MSKIKIGAVVHWNYYNTPERKFYGGVRSGEVVDVIYYNWPENSWWSTRFNSAIPDYELPIPSTIRNTEHKYYTVQWVLFNNQHLSTLQRKEIKRIVKG